MPTGIYGLYLSFNKLSHYDIRRKTYNHNFIYFAIGNKDLFTRGM
jgi:hypothetical protein